MTRLDRMVSMPVCGILKTWGFFPTVFHRLSSFSERAPAAVVCSSPVEPPTPVITESHLVSTWARCTVSLSFVWLSRYHSSTGPWRPTCAWIPGWQTILEFQDHNVSLVIPEFKCVSYFVSVDLFSVMSSVLLLQNLSTTMVDMCFFFCLGLFGSLLYRSFCWIIPDVFLGLLEFQFYSNIYLFIEWISP